MKKIFSFFAAVLFAGSMMAADELLFSQTYPGSPSKYVNSYGSSFTMTTTVSEVNYTLKYDSINNGTSKGNWTSLRAGRKSSSIAKVTSNQIAAKISKISITFTAVNAGKTNELYLLVADNADFTGATKVSATIAVGEVEFAVASPAQNQYYQIVIDQASSSSNGFNQFSAVSFYQFKEVALEDPVIAPAKSAFQESVEVSITCGTDGAKIYYTLDGTDPTATSTEYIAAFTLTETTTVKCISKKDDNTSDVFTQVFTLYPSTMTCAAAATAALSVSANNELYAEGLKFTVEGYVTDASKYSAGEYNSLFWMADEKGTEKVLEAYKPEIVGEGTPEAGDKVRVVGQLTKYNTTAEFAGGCTFTILEKGTPTAIDNAEAEVKAIKRFENGVLIIEKNGVKYNAQGAVVR